MKSPAFSFYVRDWLCSKTVARLHAAALPNLYQISTKPLPIGYQEPSSAINLRSRGVAAYVFLLCHAWLEEPQATLPNDDAELASLARVTREEWDAIKPLLMPALKEDKDTGRLYSERQMEEWLKQSNRSKANTKNVQTRYETPTNSTRTLEVANANANEVSSPGIKEGAGKHKGVEKLPSGVPATQEQAVEWAGMRGVPSEQAKQYFDQLEGRNWKDGSGQPVTNFQSYAASRYSRTKNEPNSKHATNRSQTPSERRNSQMYD